MISVLLNNEFAEIMPNWYYDKKELRYTPSTTDGINYEAEYRYRREGARFIINMGTKLGLTSDTMASAVVYFHRFYMFHSFKDFPRYVSACCCLFLAGKVEETPKKCRDIIKTARPMLTDTQFAQFGDDPREEVMTLERILLQTIKFDFQVNHPYSYLVRYAKSLKGTPQHLQKMVQMAWTFINDSLSTTLCLQWEPEIIAIALMYLACKLSKFEVTDWTGRLPSHTRWWDKFVENISKDLLEDICHQVLDLYSAPPLTSDSQGSPPTMPPSKMPPRATPHRLVPTVGSSVPSRVPVTSVKSVPATPKAARSRPPSPVGGNPTAPAVKKVKTSAPSAGRTPDKAPKTPPEKPKVQPTENSVNQISVMTSGRPAAAPAPLPAAAYTYPYAAYQQQAALSYQIPYGAASDVATGPATNQYPPPPLPQAPGGVPYNPYHNYQAQSGQFYPNNPAQQYQPQVEAYTTAPPPQASHPPIRHHQPTSQHELVQHSASGQRLQTPPPYQSNQAGPRMHPIHPSPQHDHNKNGYPPPPPQAGTNPNFPPQGRMHHSAFPPPPPFPQLAHPSYPPQPDYNKGHSPVPRLPPAGPPPRPLQHPHMGMHPRMPRPPHPGNINF